MRGAELLEATFLSMPISNQAGTRMIAPPIPNDPPVKPPANPSIIALFKNF